MTARMGKPFPTLRYISQPAAQGCEDYIVVACMEKPIKYLNGQEDEKRLELALAIEQELQG